MANLPDSFKPDKVALIQRERRALIALSIVGIVIMLTDACIDTKTINLLGTAVTINRTWALLLIAIVIHLFLLYRFWQLSEGIRYLFAQNVDSIFLGSPKLRKLWVDEVTERFDPSNELQVEAIDFLIKSELANYRPKVNIKEATVQLWSLKHVTGGHPYSWKSLTETRKRLDGEEDAKAVERIEYLEQNCRAKFQKEFVIPPKAMRRLKAQSFIRGVLTRDSFFEAWLPVILAVLAQVWVILALMSHYLETHHFWKYGAPMLRAWPNPFNGASPV